MVTDTVTAAPVWAPPRRVLFGGVATVLATIVALAVTAPDTAYNTRAADVLGLDLGWAPWLVPAANTAATLSAVAVVGLLLSAGFLATSLPAGRTRAVTVAALVWTGVTAVRICAGAAEVYGIPVRHAVEPRRLWYFVTEVPVGRALVATLALTATVALGCRFARGANGAAVLTVLAVVAVLPPVSAGHASTAGSHQVIASALMLHAASAVVWSGGLVTLAFTRDLRAAAVERFSRIALWCFAVTVATGVVGSAARLERWSDLASTRYGLVLLAKAAALVALGAFGWWHRRRSMPALAAGRPWVFVRVAAVELLVLASTMGLAVALSRTAPPNEFGTIVFDAPLTPVLRWIPEPVLLLIAVVAVTAYGVGVRRARARSRVWSRGRTAAWVVGWSLLVAAGTVQFSDVDRSGTVALLQPLVAALVVPGLLVRGAPIRLAWAAGADRLAGIAVPPVLRGPAFLAYAAVGYLLLDSVANDWASTRHGTHLLLYLGVVAAGCLVWSPAVRRSGLVRLPEP